MFFFITNNSSKSRKQYMNKIKSFGITCYENEIYSSSYGVAWYLNEIGFTKKAYIIGDEGIGLELKEYNIKFLESKEQEVIINNFNEVVNHLNIDPEIGAIIVGIDTRITFAKIAYGLHALRTLDNCLYIATNLDSTYPLTEDIVAPGTGSIVSMLTTCSGKNPIVIGKPYQLLFNLVQETHPSINKERTCMVGDRLDTDILFGMNNGIKSILVYTGISTREEVRSESNSIIPTFDIESISNLKIFYENKKILNSINIKTLETWYLMIVLF